jgi:hypothetical protein
MLDDGLGGLQHDEAAAKTKALECHPEEREARRGICSSHLRSRADQANVESRAVFAHAPALLP